MACTCICAFCRGMTKTPPQWGTYDVCAARHVGHVVDDLLWFRCGFNVVELADPDLRALQIACLNAQPRGAVAVEAAVLATAERRGRQGGWSDQLGCAPTVDSRMQI